MYAKCRFGFMQIYYAKWFSNTKHPFTNLKDFRFFCIKQVEVCLLYIFIWMSIYSLKPEIIYNYLFTPGKFWLKSYFYFFVCLFNQLVLFYLFFCSVLYFYLFCFNFCFVCFLFFMFFMFYFLFYFILFLFCFSFFLYLFIYCYRIWHRQMDRGYH